LPYQGFIQNVRLGCLVSTLNMGKDVAFTIHHQHGDLGAAGAEGRAKASLSPKSGARWFRSAAEGCLPFIPETIMLRMIGLLTPTTGISSQSCRFPLNPRLASHCASPA
jgi:hypothetical protein